jgi:outer membrane receptor protein involved in Fe transport
MLKGKHYIQETPAPGRTPIPIEFQNSGSYKIKGIELAAKGEIVKNLYGYAAYSYLDVGDLKEGVSKNKITQTIAKNKIDLSADYKLGRFKFYVGAMLVFDYYAVYAANINSANIVKLKDFNVFNAKIDFEVSRTLSIFAAADNFTNQKYEMYIVSFGADRIYEMPGASFTGGIKYKF